MPDRDLSNHAKRSELDGHKLVGWRHLLTGRFEPVAQVISTDDPEWIPVFVRLIPTWGYLYA